MTTKFIKKCLFALAASVLLTGCDAIEALPANYEKPIVEGDAIYENIMGTIYDAMSGSQKDDVLKKLKDIVAEDQFGSYKDFKAAMAGSDADKDAFIEKHAAYKHTNKIGEVEEDEFLAQKAGKSVAEIRRIRLNDFATALSKAINKSFYAEIKAKTFADDTGKFYEERLAYDKYANLYDVDVTKADWYSGYVSSSLKEEDVSAFIHLEDGRYDDYITRQIIPTVYTDKIVENYLLSHNYSTLGRAYGRKVNVITLKRDDDFKDLPNKLLNEYATTYVHGNKDIDFEVVANAWRGYYGVTKEGEPEEITDTSSDEYKLLSVATNYVTTTAYATKTERDTEWDKLDDAGKLANNYYVDAAAAAAHVHYHYFKGTQYGQLIEEYTKIDEGNKFASTEALDALNKFTSNLTYSKERGLTIELAKLALEDYTTDGWFVKNGGLSELPTELRDRLFNINVARNVDNVPPEDESHPYNSDNYVRNINGHYYLTPKTSEKGDNNNFVIYDSGTFYMVEVCEAVSTSKLDLDGKESYIANNKGDNVLFTEGVARELANALGTKDTYSTKAYSELLKGYSIKYHDSSIYDFFKETYPDLFED